MNLNSQIELVTNPGNVVHEETQLVIRSKKTVIAEAILEQLRAVKSIRYFNFDKVRLLAKHFKEHEIPAIQLIDVSETIQHENVRAKRFWQLSLELLLKGSPDGSVGQTDLWNLSYEVERAIWSRPNFGVPGVIHAVYLGNSTDLHLLEPYYFTRLDFEIQYYDDLVRSC